VTPASVATAAGLPQPSGGIRIRLHAAWQSEAGAVQAV
jgi:hypothetical protein